MEFSNLKGLSTQGMVGATAAWVDPSGDRSVLMGLGPVAGFMPKLDEAHGALVSQQVAGNKGDVEARAKALTKEAALLDAAHDAGIRGMLGILDGHIALASTDAEADRLTALRNRVFPDGASMVNRSYLEQAGETDLAAERVDHETRMALKAIPVKGGNLSKQLDAWLSCGKQLGHVAREQAELALGDASDIKPADVLNARNGWIRVVRAILAGLELADSLDDADRNRLLQPLIVAVDKASRTSLTAAVAAPAETTEADTEPTQTTES